MHDPRETSYYEIALTNRQVVVFFVVLLVCVVGSFFSGVWLGQRRAADMPRIAQAEPAEEAAENREPLEELNFFTDDPDPSSSPARGRLEPAGNPETTLLEDVQGAESRSGDSRTVEPQSVEPGAVEPTRSVPDPPRRESPRQPEVEPATVAEGFVIQVFSSPDGAQARKLLDRLAGGGYEAYLSPVEVEGRTMYRVRLGPLETRRSADRLAAEVAKAYQLETWITRNE